MGILNKIKKGTTDAPKKNVDDKMSKEQVSKAVEEDIHYMKDEIKGFGKQLRTKESIVVKNEIIAILHSGIKNQKSFLDEFEKLTKDGYKLSAVSETKGLPITPFGFNIKTGKLFFFQRSKWIQ